MVAAHGVRAMQAGGPEVLEFGEIEVAAPGPGEILVDVKAAGINFIDTYRRSGVYPMDYPHTVGVEGSGIVAEVGEGVTAWSAGDRVAWHDGPGSYATRATLRADMAMRVPDGIDFDVAAAIPLQGLTAQYLVTGSHRIEAGQTALVHAAAGGVGLLLIQLIKHLGGRVIGTVSTEEKAELARAAGADDVFLYGEGVDVAQTVLDLTDGRGVDGAYDGVGRDTFDASLRATAVRGSLVLFGGASGQVPPFDIQRLNGGGGVFLSRPSLTWFVRTPEELAERSEMLFAGLSDGWLDFRVGETFALADADEAHRALEGRRTTGKVVLTT
ncbi:quinone oxidoreductase family protein [Brevibacterium jeotgali]|uniref:NADPH2:quinone reductase n=1 Tax=Brevibacterium jeotgali TaxID=1262550 RepID=A0A2H1L384_9MICO|nr:quinone oxidoreductase [Brevibacterium jeotgali]TWC02569.1 NADPH2:quinone reductase [Brevibacterium jeotgali]SMY11362.1 NADPH2:quinone reductase [Brevibacterium jeotgali]